MTDPHCAITPHRSWLLRLVRSRLAPSPLSDDATAEDVVQEVSLAAVRSENRPTEADELRNWLCRIALRQCSLVLRKGVRSQAVIDGAAPLLADRPPTIDPIDWLIADEDQSLIRDAMQQITEDSRTVLAWKYVDRLDYQTIAKRLGVTRHTAEYRVVKARNELRREMTELGLGPEEKP